MKDGLLRRTVKAAARALWTADLLMTRWILRRRGEIPYALGGECRRCARCCEEPAIRTCRLVWFVPGLKGLFLWWQRAVNGFERVGEDPGRRLLRFRCTHFDAAARSCDSYASRPGICRDYPRGLLGASRPDFFPECGYRPVVRNATAFLESLRRRRLPPEQVEELKKKLFLE